MLLSTFTVTNPDDRGPGSLRQAILDSNAATGQTNTISFAIPGQGVRTIAPASPLPPITRAVLIDGWSQPGFGGMPQVELDGSQAGGGDGLTLIGSDSTIRGLIIHGFAAGAGILIAGTAATGNRVVGAWIGTDVTGTQALPNHVGVRIGGGAHGNIIGTDGDSVNDVSERNLLSGNGFAGVWITGPGTDGNAVAGNFIGTDISGAVPLGNGAQSRYDPDQYATIGGGVVIEGGASTNRIGIAGTHIDTVGGRNVIAGNQLDGIDIVGSGTSGNIVTGNFVGTDATGTLPLANWGDGVFLGEGASSNRVGVAPNGDGGIGDEGNVIAGNGYDGIEILSSDGNVVAGNCIGTDATGTGSLPNYRNGIYIEGDSRGNTIGGIGARAQNLITHNQGAGVAVLTYSFETGFVVIGGGNEISGNRIFANGGQAIDLFGDGVTYNSPSPGPEPFYFPNYPILVTGADGRLQGWLGGSTPDTPFHLEFFASATYGPGGAGEAEAYLGSLEVTTDSQGDAFFDVPYVAPADRPIITATATDPHGNTSEVSALRRVTLEAPSTYVRLVPDWPLIFSAAAGNALSLQDPDAGTLDPVWDLTLSVSSGTLALGSTTGLTGSGDGTGSLSYSGSRSALNAAMEGLRFTPPPGPQSHIALSLTARADGAPPLQVDLTITDGVFSVTTTADSGPGSLRQAIFDANATPGGVTIAFAIPGEGVQTIAPTSPLPAITGSVLIDGSSQPGSAGSPGIELSGSQAGTADGLTITGSGSTIRGLAIHGFAAGAGILIAGTTATGNRIEANAIGTDPTGSPASPNGFGVRIRDGAHDNLVGGTTAAEGNLIAFNTGRGIAVEGFVGEDSGGNRITANRIFANPGPAIDLNLDGVTENSASPRSGPNKFQNFPIVVRTAAGPLRGWLGGSTPYTAFHVEFFASVGAGPGGAGEAEVYLGSVEVTTDAAGEASFEVPYVPPADKPLISVTATDPRGNTSEVSPLRRATLDAPTTSVRLVPGQPLTFSAAAGDAMTLQDPDAGTMDPAWDLTISVTAGTMALASTVGLTGSGNGTGTLHYRGALSVLKAALEGLRYTPPPQSHVLATLSLDAQSDGAESVHAQLVITDGDFAVVTTADSGPGSFRQAILESNTVTGGRNTIEFAIPGAGVHAIALTSPLPPITTSVLIDGPSQPGYSGTPLLELSGPSGGNPDGLAIAGAQVTVRGLAIAEFAFDTGWLTDGLTLSSGPLRPIPGGHVDSYRIVASSDGRWTARVHPQGLTTRLSLIDAGGHVLVQSEGLAPTDPDDLIDQHLPAGTYVFKVASTGAGDYVLTTLFTTASAPFQPIAIDTSPSPPPPVYYDHSAPIDHLPIIAGDFNGDGLPDLATLDGIHLGVGDGTFRTPLAGLGLTLANPISTAMTSGDFNEDGRLDLAVADATSHTITVLLGGGDGTFQARPPIAWEAGPPNPSGPVSLVADHVDDDGHLDLVAVRYDSSVVTLLLGTGRGTFLAHRPILLNDPSSSPGPVSLAVEDFNGDGHRDLAVANSSVSTVSVLLGHGDGEFELPLPSYAGSNPQAIVTGDFNGDELPDLAVADSFYWAISILLGQGNGTFSPAESMEAGIHPGSLSVGDFNGDGQLDLAAANVDTNDISVLLGHGDGTFEPQKAVATGDRPSSLVAADFNADGHLDLATSNLGSQGMYVLLGNGDGTFQDREQNLAGSGPGSLATGDFNGDGWTDLVVGNQNSGTVSVLLSRGDGTFQAQEQFRVGRIPHSLVTGDFNGDGRLDVATANWSSSDVSVLLGNGDGTFDDQKRYTVGASLSSLVTWDFNGDHHLDLVTNYGSSDGFSVLLGHGDGTFQPPMPFAGMGSNWPQSLVVGFFNGDDRPDLATITSTEVSVLLGNGNGSFQAPMPVLDGVQGLNLVSGDFNGDGLLDLAATSSSGLSIILGNGNGTFRPADTIPTPNSFTLAAEDFNRDGRLDLASVSYDDTRTVSVWLNNGDGTFQPSNQFPVGRLPYALGTGDFNGDGRLDLASANLGSGSVSVLLGDGGGRFGDPGQLSTIPHATPLVTDVNGDGTDDGLVVDAAGEILDRQGQPGRPGSFDPPITINPGFPSRDIAVVADADRGRLIASVDAGHDAVSLFAWRQGGFVRIGSLTTGILPAQIVAADLNRDGWDDLVVRNAGDGTLSVFFNTNIGPGSSGTDSPLFLPPEILPVGLGVSDVQAVDTTGIGALDLVVTNRLTGQVSVLRNRGNLAFAPPITYRAGAGLVGIDASGDSPIVASLEGTIGVAAGGFTRGGSTDLVTINPGSNTLGWLVGLGQGRFANPVAIPTGIPARVVRVADFNHDGVPDLALLGAEGLNILPGDGQGGFSPATPYDAGPDPTGLTLADINHDGQLDLLVGNPYGDVLMLLGQDDGIFRPFLKADRSIALAVADLDGDGVADFVFADQGLDRVTVDFGGGSTAVVGDRASGLLAPGAVHLADMNSDGIKDLVVANSGSNNILVYLGIGAGQFGPAVNGGHGFFTGTNPTGFTITDVSGDGRPDLLVANTGSNDVSVLLGQGSGSTWTLIPGPRIKTGAGPVAVAVGDVTGDGQPDLAVANQQANDVQVFPGVGGGFFNDQAQAVQTYAVGQAPAGLFLGTFDGSLGVAALDAGSNTVTMISNLGSASPLIRTVGSGGLGPIAGFAGDFNGDGFSDMVVANRGSGQFGLLLGGSGGLSLAQTLVDAAAPSPTAVSFAGVSDGALSFYASTAGREAALHLAFELGGLSLEPGTPFPEPGGLASEPGGLLGGVPIVVVGPGSGPDVPSGSLPVPGVEVVLVARLSEVSGTALDLIATLVTLTVAPGGPEGAFDSAGGPELLAVFGPGGTTGFGQGMSPGGTDEDGVGDEAEAEEEPAASAAGDAAGDWLAPWQRLAAGLEEAWEDLRARMRRGDPATPDPEANPDDPPTDSPPASDRDPAGSTPSTDGSRPEPEPCSTPALNGAERSGLSMTPGPNGAAQVEGAPEPIAISGPPAALALRIATVDAALERLDEAIRSSDSGLGLAAPVAADTEGARADPLLTPTAVLALALTWDRAIAASRLRGRANAGPRRLCCEDDDR